MTNKKYVEINGRAYNPVTGLPMDDIKIKKNPASSADTDKVATSAPTVARGTGKAHLHANATRKSTTLNRRHVKKPHQTPLAARKIRQPLDIKPHAAVQKFAPNPVAAAAKNPEPASVDRPAENHPMTYRAKNNLPSANARLRKERTLAPMTAAPANRTQAPQQPIAPKPAKDLKHDAITEALSKEITTNKRHKTKKERSRFSRWAQSLSIGISVMLLGGYLTYLSMPNISIRVAAVQSGINAKYPGYSPSGYALKGPISFKSGEVSMRFAYTDGSTDYTLKQQKSNWDSAAVKEYLSETTKNPTTTSINGLTIYSSGTHAVWVNGGIMYEINGSAPLSNEQIEKIAASL